MVKEDLKEAKREKFLRENGYEVLECGSDQEAIDKAEDLKKGSKQYPVHYSGSDTTGEKAYEELRYDEL